MSTKRKWNGKATTAKWKKSVPQKAVITKVVKDIARKTLEVKMIDTPLSHIVSDDVVSNNAFQAINVVAVGAHPYNRVGRKITCKSVRCRFHLQTIFGSAATTSNLTNQVVRLAVLIDKQPSGGGVPSWLEVFGGIDAAGSATTDFMNQNPAPATKQRFKLLRDMEVVIDMHASNHSGGTQNLSVVNTVHDIFVDLKNMETVYAGSSTTDYATIETAGLLFISCALNNEANVCRTTILGTARLSYYDG